MSTSASWRVCLLALCAAGVVWGQSTAQINGTVRDASGAAVPGAEVKATQTATGAVRTANSGADGGYVLPNLPIGPYQVEVTKEGFTKYVQSGIVLEVAGNPTVDVGLKVGAVTEQVLVEAGAALVETRSTGVGTVMENQRVLELPLNGRQVSDLIFLSGAATNTSSYSAGSRAYSQTPISVGGGVGSGVTYLLDGGIHNDPYTGLGMVFPFPDALQEFKLETSALPAQYGHHSSAAVNAVTKAGTNEFHGDLFEFVRNGAFNARNAFALTTDTLKRNQYGGTAGGAIIKNKLFFFGGHQTTTQRASSNANIAYIPTPAMIAGDFTAFASPACNSGKALSLPAPFAGNKISPSLFSPAALNLSNRLPITADPCGQIKFDRAANSNEHITVGKGDYQKSDKHSMFLRYLEMRLNNPSDNDPKNPLAASTGDLFSRIYSGVFGDTYLIGSGTVSTFRATFNRISNDNSPPSMFDFHTLGVKDIFVAVPNQNRITVSNGFSIGSSNTIVTQYITTSFEFAQDFSVVRGAHQFGFGGDYIRMMETNHSGLNANPAATFNGQTTGNGLADFMLGKMSSLQQGGTTQVYKRQNYEALYFQDTWKLNSRLTLNTGVRWEPYLPPIHKYGYFVHFEQAAFNQNIHSTVYKNAPAGLLFPGDAGRPDNKYNENHWKHFAPRIGLAWDPMGNGRMTIRAAYGLFYESPYFQKYGGLSQSAPFAGLLNFTSPPGGLDNPWQGYPGGNPFPIVLSANTTFPAFGSYPTIPTDTQNPYVNQWNLSIQRQIGTEWLVSGNYLGSSTIHLWSSLEANPAIYLGLGACTINGVNYATCSTTGNTLQRRALYLQNPTQGQFYGVVSTLNYGATSSYNALLLSIQRRHKGMTVQGNYTWSHCIGDPEEPQLGIGSSYAYPGRRNFYRGNCTSDVRQNFNISAVYETPKFMNKALRWVASNWQVSGIVRAKTGSYLTVASGFDTALTASIGSDRANLVLADPYAANKGINGWLNPAAFARPATGTWGNLGILNILGPGAVNIDMGLSRTFTIREGKSLQLRGEAFNLPNHVNPGNPIVAVNNQNFGKIQNTANGRDGDPRILQLALKFVF